jgi:hypothetical protein
MLAVKADLLAALAAFPTGRPASPGAGMVAMTAAAELRLHWAWITRTTAQLVPVFLGLFALHEVILVASGRETLSAACGPRTSAARGEGVRSVPGISACSAQLRHLR